ncbi:MAG: peptidoglycan DD-metalloendopeptidase family protein [Bacteroidales bacterium]|nr:peptidoglycan DD-metalloendopeptidase family protein [Bacteroidales bacterium]
MKLKILWISLIIATTIYSCNSDSNKKSIPEHKIAEQSAPKETLFFEIPVDSLSIEKYKIGKNENLSDILSRHDVGYDQIFRLVENAKGKCNVKRIKRGNTYYLLKSKDSIPSLQYMIYQKNRVEYVVFSMKDSLQVWNGKKEVKRVLDTVSGIVTSSLWMALYEQGTNPELANELSDIYGWTIDFFGIQKGDYFKVYFEHLVVDQDTFGIGNIFAANFNHYHTDYQAYYFIQDSVGEFFDEKGNSLRKTFLKAPLRYKRISSGFSHSRFHPVLKKYRPHHGVDYAAASGTPVYTIGDGRVIKRGYQKNGGGNYIKVKHNSNYTTVYMHLKGFAKGMNVGKTLKQGDLIGYVGATGLATGPHLDFRVYKNGVAINPLKMKSTPTKPVDSLSMNQYQSLVDSLWPLVQ